MDWELFKTEFDNAFEMPKNLNTRWHIDEGIKNMLNSISITVEKSTIKAFKTSNRNDYDIPPKRILSLIKLNNYHRRLWQRQR